MAGRNFFGDFVYSVVMKSNPRSNNSFNSTIASCTFMPKLSTFCYVVILALTSFGLIHAFGFYSCTRGVYKSH